MCLAEKKEQRIQIEHLLTDVFQGVFAPGLNALDVAGTRRWNRSQAHAYITNFNPDIQEQKKRQSSAFSQINHYRVSSVSDILLFPNRERPNPHR